MFEQYKNGREGKKGTLLLTIFIAEKYKNYDIFSVTFFPTFLEILSF